LGGTAVLLFPAAEFVRRWEVYTFAQASK
jgi:hypothetical protein